MYGEGDYVLSCQLHDLSHLIWVLCIDHVTGGGNPVVRQKDNKKVRTKCQMICWNFVRTFFVVICHFLRLNFLGILSGHDLGFCSKHIISLRFTFIITTSLLQKDLIWHFWSFSARPYRLIWCPVGGLVGGCGAWAVSRMTSI